MELSNCDAGNMLVKTSRRSLVAVVAGAPASADQRGRKPVLNTGARRSGRGLGSGSVTYVFVFLGSIIIRRVYKLNLSDKSHATVQLRVSLSDLT